MSPQILQICHITTPQMSRVNREGATGVNSATCCSCKCSFCNISCLRSQQSTACPQRTCCNTIWTFICWSYDQNNRRISARAVRNRQRALAHVPVVSTEAVTWPPSGVGKVFSWLSRIFEELRPFGGSSLTDHVFSLYHADGRQRIRGRVGERFVELPMVPAEFSSGVTKVMDIVFLCPLSVNTESLFTLTILCLTQPGCTQCLEAVTPLYIISSSLLFVQRLYLRFCPVDSFICKVFFIDMYIHDLYSWRGLHSALSDWCRVWLWINESFTEQMSWLIWGNMRV